MQWQTHAAAKKKDAWEQNCSSCGSVAPAKALLKAEPSVQSDPKQAVTPGSGSGCCKHCKTGCPCGDSCIPCDTQCQRPPGCACEDGP
jgi:hypothetical protein